VAQLSRACGQNRVVLFSCLLSHSAAPGLGPLERAALARHAARQGCQLEEALQPTAMGLALGRLPEAWGAALADGAAQQQQQQQLQLQGAVLESVRQLAAAAADPAQVCAPAWPPGHLPPCPPADTGNESRQPAPRP
jgi:hypothetical protein